MTKAVAFRFGELIVEEFDSLDEADEFLMSGSETGEHAPVGTILYQEGQQTMIGVQGETNSSSFRHFAKILQQHV